MVRLGVHIGREKMVLARKKWQELRFFWAVGYEGAKRGAYVLAERWGKINPQVEFDMSGGRALDAEGQ